MDNLLAALKLLYLHNQRLNWDLTGGYNAAARAAIMSTLVGSRVPQSKSGITALRQEFYRVMDIQGSCLANQEDNFRSKAKVLLGI